MTNGIFDILHAGHVSYLANARKLGDRLIVAVNSDASTKRLKGETRPVNALENRMIVLGALEAVDWVVPFEEDTPQRLIADILPDLLVKGGDYKPEEIAGSAEVWANGGDVKVLNFEDGLSTTNIIKAIKTGGLTPGDLKNKGAVRASRIIRLPVWRLVSRSVCFPARPCAVPTAPASRGCATAPESVRRTLRG